MSDLVMFRFTCSACGNIYTHIMYGSLGYTSKCHKCGECYYFEDGKWHNEKCRSLVERQKHGNTKIDDQSA